MALPAFNPHPLGCPIGLALSPDEMQASVTDICIKLRDVVFPKVHVVNPSRGEPYPMLNLHTQRDDVLPRVVFFPGWEDKARRRRLDWKRQATLMKRIHDAGVEGEAIDVAEGEQAGTPLMLSLCCVAAGMDQVVNDLYDYLGDIVRLTISSIAQQHGPDVRVVRLYALNSEPQPRLMLFPGWTGTEETRDTEIDYAHRRALARQADRTAEIPAEIFLRRL